VKVDVEITASTVVSFETGAVLNVGAGTKTTINGELDTTDGTVNYEGALDGSGNVTGSGSLVKKPGGSIAGTLTIDSGVEQIDESATNPSNPPAEAPAESMGCDSGIPGIVLLTLPAIFSFVQTVKKRALKLKKK
jgi:hypothetical protein